jgi:hypothetical protein
MSDLDRYDAFESPTAALPILTASLTQGDRAAAGLPPDPRIPGSRTVLQSARALNRGRQRRLRRCAGHHLWRHPWPISRSDGTVPRGW